MLTFAIPTFNRLERLKRCLHSLLTGIVAIPPNSPHYNRVKIHVFNHGSDGTAEYLEGMQQRYAGIVSIVNSPVEVTPDSLKLAVLHPETEWIWMMGDDDLLIPGVLMAILDFLNTRAEELGLHFVRVAESARTEGTRKIFVDTLLGLANGMGFLEVTGFMSCNIVRRQRIREGYESRHYRVYTESAFSQSLVLLEALHDKKCAYLDIAAVELQDQQQTPETVQRWQAERMVQRYNKLVLGLDRLAAYGVMPTAVSDDFFRYIRGNLFGKILHTFCQETNRTGVIPDDDEWDRLMRLAGYLDTESRQAMQEAITNYRAALETLVATVNENSDLIQRYNSSLQHLNTCFDKAVPAEYPYNYL